MYHVCVCVCQCGCVCVSLSACMCVCVCVSVCVEELVWDDILGEMTFLVTLRCTVCLHKILSSIVFLILMTVPRSKIGNEKRES